MSGWGPCPTQQLQGQAVTPALSEEADCVLWFLTQIFYSSSRSSWTPRWSWSEDLVAEAVRKKS